MKQWISLLVLMAMEYQPVDSIAGVTTITVIESWRDGLEPVDRPMSSQPHSIVATVIVVLFTMIALASSNLRRIVSSIGTEMLGIRRRNNAFDTHTSAESRTLAILIILGATCEAVILGSYLSAEFTSLPVMFCTFVGISLGYYLFRLAAYSLVGYVFTDASGAASWRRGFNLSEGLLGILLLVPAVVILFYPSLASVVIVISAVMYMIVRILFIYKGFRIFYNGFGDFVYFILYLCTLEIIPLIVVYSAAKMESGL